MRGGFAALVLSVWSLVAAAAEYHVGPNQELANVSDVPWEALEQGDAVFIHGRQAEYAEKWAILRGGVTVRGVADPETEELPIITGLNAVTRRQLVFAEESRAILVIAADDVLIEGLRFRRAREGDPFRKADRSAGVFGAKAAAIHSTQSKHLTLRGCSFTDLDQAVFLSGAVVDPLIEHNVFRENSSGTLTGAANLLLRALRPVVQHNDFGPPSGLDADNVFDASAGLTLRYNLLIGGNRLLNANPPEPPFGGEPEAAWLRIYGNQMVKRLADASDAVLHFEAPPDGGRAVDIFNNSMRLERQTVRVVSMSIPPGVLLRLHNNVVDATGQAAPELIYGYGALSFGGNWLYEGTVAKGGGTAQVTDLGGNLTGTDPQFRDLAAGDLRPARGSPLIDAAPPLPDGLQPPEFEPGSAWPPTPRGDDGRPDIGAYEYRPDSPPERGESLVGWSVSCGSAAGCVPLAVLLLVPLLRLRTAQGAVTKGRSSS